MDATRQHRAGVFIMELLYALLGVNLCILGYFAYRFMEFRKTQLKREQLLLTKSLEEIARAQKEYSRARMEELSDTHKKTNVFRELAIEEISKQKLVFDEETGAYVRLRQIN